MQRCPDERHDEIMDGEAFLHLALMIELGNNYDLECMVPYDVLKTLRIHALYRTLQGEHAENL